LAFFCVRHVNPIGKEFRKSLQGQRPAAGCSSANSNTSTKCARAAPRPPAFTEWATLAQYRAGWRKHVTDRPFDVGKSRVWPSPCDTRLSPEDMRRFMAQRAAEVVQRRAIFDAAVATPTP
jgi:hypothetical protein